MEFEWDDPKAASNRRKHGVSFEEAQTVFDDPNVSIEHIEHDEEHSRDEERWVAIGLSNRGRLLVVAHTYRDGAVRLISARRAGRVEVERYGQT